MMVDDDDDDDDVDDDDDDDDGDDYEEEEHEDKNDENDSHEMSHRHCGLAVKTLAQRSGGTGSFPGRVKTRTLKLVLVADPPGFWHYGFSAKSGRPGVRIM
ncbi:hypothetical protein ElyMa_006929200 [Elysia marginata]|uniref:Uncharacterized protein n=1 Tax=Elysia marginata TaxID=1093978 RepID=A0AAV4JJF5_9GAST|nr:hypothetical protein ElyMa_006929200 [Elysia marginata]